MVPLFTSAVCSAECDLPVRPRKLSSAADTTRDLRRERMIEVDLYIGEIPV
jgi:hypothetical protein